MSFLLGILLCVVSVALVIVRTGSAAVLWDLRALLLVLCGTLAYLLVTVPLPELPERLGSLRGALSRQKSTAGLTEEILKFAQVARREGVLALEGPAAKADDSILRKGLELIADSADRETVRSVLEKQSEYMTRRENAMMEHLDHIAAFATGIGMVGTLLEIVEMLSHYSGPTSLAPQIARALLPVAYGALLAYLVFFPLSARLRSSAEQRVTLRELAAEGVLAIQAGEPIHIVEQRMKTYLASSPGEKSRGS